MDAKTSETRTLTKNEFQKYLKAWKRYCDDIYIVWSGGSETFDCFFWQLNYKHPKIQFTIEGEVNGVFFMGKVGYTQLDTGI